MKFVSLPFLLLRFGRTLGHFGCAVVVWCLGCCWECVMGVIASEQMYDSLRICLQLEEGIMGLFVFILAWLN